MTQETKKIERFVAATGAVLYDGPSRINKAPIVAIMTYKSSNVKTGDMPQVWIMHKDDNPFESRISKADNSVCGGCAFAHDNGCYVHWFQLNSIYTAFQAGKYKDWAHAERWIKRNDPSTFRLGAYGDPVAVPLEVWDKLKEARPSASIIGYTQLWGSRLSDGYKQYLMASTKSPQEYERAKQKGWRSFRVALPEDETPKENEIVCPATVSGDATCKQCKLCVGGTQGTDIVEALHGPPYIVNRAGAVMRALRSDK